MRWFVTLFAIWIVAILVGNSLTLYNLGFMNGRSTGYFYGKHATQLNCDYEKTEMMMQWAREKNVLTRRLNEARQSRSITSSDAPTGTLDQQIAVLLAYIAAL